MPATSRSYTPHSTASKACLSSGVAGGGRTLNIAPAIGAGWVLRECCQKAALPHHHRSCPGPGSLWHGEGREGK